MRQTTKKSTRLPRQVPKPKGPYAVGCTDVMTALTADGQFFRLFYPAEPVENPVSPEWLPDEKYLEGYAIFFKIWSPLFCKTFPKFVGDIHIPASWNAPPLKAGNKFPLVIFSHGLGGCRTSYTTFCLELASNGYIVAALEHRDYSACNTFYYLTSTSATDDTGNNEKPATKCSPQIKEMSRQWMLLRKVKNGKEEYGIRNKQVHYRAKECTAVLDFLTAVNDGSPVQNVMPSSTVPLESLRGLINTNQVAVAGHSFGGATVIAAMAQDTRFRVGLGLDTWMLPLREETSLFCRVNQPMLFVNMEKFQTKSNLRVMKKMESTKTERRILTLKGTVHLNQCDVPFLCDGTMRRIFGAHSQLNRFTAMDLTTQLSMEFLSKHLGLAMNVEYRRHISEHRSVIIEGIKS